MREYTVKKASLVLPVDDVVGQHKVDTSIQISTHAEVIVIACEDDPHESQENEELSAIDAACTHISAYAEVIVMASWKDPGNDPK